MATVSSGLQFYSDPDLKYYQC